MGSLVVISLLALLSPGIHGAALPSRDGYAWRFNQMGVQMSLALKDQTNPLVGGKAHVELPISAIWKLVEGENELMKTLLIALEKTTLGNLYDIQTVKGDITYNAERVLEGIFNIAIDYTLVHKDGTEEKGTMLLQGKSESGMIVTSLEVITNSLQDTSRQIILPVQLSVTCSWPNTHAIAINGSFGKILINIANDLNEVSARGVWEYLGQQYKYSSVLSIKEKYFTLTCQDPTEQPKTLVVMPKIINSLPTIEITGQVPTTPWFEGGEINTQLTPFNLFDYDIKHSNGKMEITLKYFLQTTQIIIEYSKTMVKFGFPVTYSNKKMLEIEMEYKPTDNTSLLAGGNIKIMVSQDSMPIIKIGGYCGLSINVAKNEVVFNDFYIDVMNGALKASFAELRLSGKIFIDPVNKNGLLPKISVEAKMEKDNKEMLNILLSTIETPYKLRIYCPYLIKNILNIQTIEYLEILHSHIVTGKETTITTICNFTNMKLIAKIAPTMISYELLDGEVSLIRFLNQMTEMKFGTNSYLVKAISKLHLNDKAYLYKVLSYISNSLCFKDFTTMYHLEVVDMAARKVNIQAQVTKDMREILNINVNNEQVPTITTICNFPSMKFIAKIKPSIISYELLDGDVSLIKYLNQLTMELGTNSYLVKGKANLHLNENSFIYKILSYLSTSLCFKDWTSNYHLKVLDMAARKVNVQVHVTKDVLEILNIDVNNEQVPTITTICNFPSKKFISKITPTMISYELLDGEVSLVKYLNQLTMELGTESYTVKGKANLHLNENSFIFKILSYVSTSLCFKDWTSNYHIKVLDMAARKVNVQVHVTKDMLEILNVDVNNEQVPTITTTCNFPSKKFISKITPTMISYELLDGEVSLVKYLNQLTIELGTNSYLVKGKANLHLNENSFIYKILSYVSTSLCFKDWTSNYHLNVFDMVAKKVNIQVQVTKDMLEILNIDVNNEHVLTMTTICNFPSKKFIAKITPKMISYELLDGKISLVKYVNQLTMEVGTNSYFVKGQANLHLNENSFIYKVLSYVSTSLCFKDWTSNYHLKVLDMAARKFNVQVQVTKDMLEILNVDVNNEQVPTITAICNFPSKKFISKITPTMISYELLDGEVSLIKYLNQLTMEVGTNSYLVKGKANLHLNENSFIHKILSYVSTSLCFKDWTSNYHLEVLDTAARKINVQIHVTKDMLEILKFAVNNEQVPTMTTICNFPSKKFIAKITPTMISYELLDDEVSLVKYLNQLTVEVGTNSYLVKGKANLHLKENSFIYKVLSYVSTSLCFKDWTANYHLEVVDKTAKKFNVQVQVTKDTLQILNVDVTNEQVPTMTTICNFPSKKFIAKITPTMISYELLDGEVSLVKYLNQLTVEVGTNSYLVKGKANLSLKENSFIHKVLSCVSTSLCFSDWTANYHLEVVDKAARKVNVQIQVTKDTLEILNVEINNAKVPTITTICNFPSKKFIAKITPTMISYELLDDEISLIRYLNQLIMEVGTNSYLVKGQANLHMNEKSFIYKVLSYVSTSFSFKDWSANYHLEILDMAERKVNVQVQVKKDTLEILNVEVNNVKVLTITAVCNFISKRFIAKITPTMITYELLDGGVSLIKYLNQLTKMEIGANSYLVKGKTNLHLNENSYLYTVQCFVSNSLCFKDLTTNYHLEMVDKTTSKVNVQVHVTKDMLDILHVEVNNIQVPYKITVKTSLLPFEMIVGYELSTKEWKVMINNISLMKVKPTFENLYVVDVFEVPLVQVALLKKQVKVSTITKVVPEITAIISWKTFSIFENSVGIQLLNKQMAYKTLFGWNINQLKKAFVDIKVTGSGFYLLGDYQLFHHLNWYITDITNVDFEWNSKVLATGLAYLNKPLVTDGKLKMNNNVIDMELVENFDNEQYTLILKNKPLKIALLPFFAYP